MVYGVTRIQVLTAFTAFKSKQDNVNAWPRHVCRFQFRSQVEMTTRSEEEIDKFRKMADEWWEPDGNLKGLHSMNGLRVAMVAEAMGKSGTLEGCDILDVGCGGGILSEALADLGARVTGLDACKENIGVARSHADGRDRRSSGSAPAAGSVKYEALTAEEYEAQGPNSIEPNLD